MQSRSARRKEIRVTIRMCAEDHRVVSQTAKAKGYANPSAFIREAIRNEIQGRSELTGVEERIVGSLERLSKDNFQTRQGQQALFALVEALTKTVLTCMPEPPYDAKPQAVALAKDRYHSLVKSAARAMSGEGRTAMEELAGNDQER
jgi:hypothetical protein